MKNRTDRKKELNQVKKISSDKPTLQKPQITKSNKIRKPNDSLGIKSKQTETSIESTRNESILRTVISSPSNVQNVQGVTIEDLVVGTGATASMNNRVKVDYKGWLKNGRLFDSSSSKPFQFRLGCGEVIRGWDIGVLGMKVNGKRKLTIPPEKAYGKSGAPPVIPPNSTLIFEITLLSC